MICKNCGKQINRHNLITSWDESASYYSIKVKRCPECKEIIAIVKYGNELNLDINNDIRYYMYNKHVNNINKERN